MGYRRAAHAWSELADALVAEGTHDIAVARFNCEASGAASRFCNSPDVRLRRTPTFRVYHSGKEALDYRSHFYVAELMKEWVKRLRDDLQGQSSAANAEPKAAA